MKIFLAALLLAFAPVAANANPLGIVYHTGYITSPFGYAACIGVNDAFTQRWSNFSTELDGSFYVYCY